MKKASLFFLFCAGIFAIAPPLQAQNGCVNSPENPTAVLALVGSAGAFCATRVRARTNRNKASREERS